MWQKYCQDEYWNITREVKKQFQEADWSQRPLSTAMLDYAAHDAHFLIHIAYSLLREAQLIMKDEDIEKICL